MLNLNEWLTLLIIYRLFTCYLDEFCCIICLVGIMTHWMKFLHL